MSERKPMIAGNWKMNLTLEQSTSLVKTIVKECGRLKGVEVLVAPPFTALSTIKEAIGDSGILLAAQNMHWELEGAYTGEISPKMLVEAGCSHVILGHSERRNLFFETNDTINLKTEAAICTGLVPIVCIGETLDQREQGQTSEVIREQLEGSLKNLLERKNLPLSTILAYE
ncbi:MAG: triose-phosphate isomerase, partial [Deltaproteobacteria bacterium]